MADLDAIPLRAGVRQAENPLGVGSSLYNSTNEPPMRRARERDGRARFARLTSFERASSTTTYGWQQVPNRDQVQVDAADPDTYTFDAANRETDSSLGDFEYDDEGRLVVRPGQDLAWNDLGQLIEVDDSSTQAVIATYTYDAVDRLLTVDHGGSDVVRLGD